jgi:hypothetical protein
MIDFFSQYDKHRGICFFCFDFLNSLNIAKQISVDSIVNGFTSMSVSMIFANVRR